LSERDQTHIFFKKYQLGLAGATTFRIVALSITTFSIMTLSIKGLLTTLSINDI
jgi:hypothetical protein